MIKYRVNDRAIQATEDGFLLNWTDWTAEVARAIAAEDGLTLTETHWTIIRFLRDYYETKRLQPAARVLGRVLAKHLGPEHGDPARLVLLFPHGPARQSARIAGLPKPAGCL